jgi:ABC-type nickel/cobalt efflux system permease component RcnA
LGVSSYFAAASAVVPMRVAAGLLLLAVGLYNFWRAMMEKG